MRMLINLKNDGLKKLEENPQFNTELSTSNYMEISQKILENGGKEALIKMIQNIEEQAEQENKKE